MDPAKKFALFTFLAFQFLILVANGEFKNSSDIGNLEVLKALQRTSLKFGADPELQKEVFKDIVAPSYVQRFAEIIRERMKTDPMYPENLFKGIDNIHCKGHILEWFIKWIDTEHSDLFGDKDKWVLQMIDSWGKFPEGILSGHINSLGDFWECAKVDVSSLQFRNPWYQNASTEFRGKYCTVYMLTYDLIHPPATVDMREIDPVHEGRNFSTQDAVSVKELLEFMLGGKSPMLMMLPSAGVCFPNTCSNEDIQLFMMNSLEILYNSIPGVDPKLLPWPGVVSCSEEKKPDLDSSVIIFIVVLGVLVALCVGSAVMDYWLTNCTDKRNDVGLPLQIFLAFSMYTNTRKWLSTRKGAEDFGCLHGIRTLSTAWVVLAHTYVVSMFVPQWNSIDYRKIQENNMTVLAILNGFFSVDTFFLMSGMLACFGILKLLDKSNGRINVPMFYIHRYLRLTPLYAFLIGIVATLEIYMGNGPLYNMMMLTAQENCRNNWWVNLLYINNLYRTDTQCNGESWYLANDMQFYILSPLIVYPIWRWEKIGLALLGCYVILSMISPAVIVNYHDTVPVMIVHRDFTDFQKYVYVKPWARIGVFLVGIFLGWLLYRTRGQKVKMPWYVVVGGWMFSTAAALYVILCIYPWYDTDNDIPKWYGLMYAALSRHIWGLAIGWVIFACVKGYGGIVNSFLSWSAFMPLGRLCFGVYLTSYQLQQIYILRSTHPLTYDTYNFVYLFFGHMVMSYIVGYFCTLLFESPFIILQKLLFEGPSKRPQDTKTKTEQK